MSHVVVLGAGELGSAVARALSTSGVVQRVALVDDAEDVARGKALDIQQAGAIEPTDARLAGSADSAAVVGAAAVVFADRHGTGSWGTDDGLAMLARIRALNPRALVVGADAGHFDLVERAVVEQNADRRRLIGSATEALRAGAVALTCLEAGCGPRDLSLALLGRPPRGAFVPWSAAAIAGLRADEMLAPVAIARLEERIGRLWPPGPVALAAAASRVVRLALTGGPGMACVFAVPDREGDKPTRGAALPAVFSPAGLRITLPPLTTRDRVRLDQALAG
ncbi:MAG: hypothetical protein AB7H93_02725 [Vicinamibacterales bacterium]